MMAWLLGAKKVVGPASTPAGFAGMTAMGSSYTPMTGSAVRNGGGANGMMPPATLPAEEQQHQQQHEQYVPNDDGGDGHANASTTASANNGSIHADPTSATPRHGDDDHGINPLNDGYGGGGNPNNEDAAAGAGVADGAIVAASASRWFDEDTFNAQKERAMTAERSGIQAVYSELYDALQVLAEAMQADMEERQQRQLHDYQAKVNEIRECCQRSERLEEMLGHIFQSVNMVYNAVWTGATAT